jgi:hypothetical protein
MLIYVHTHTHTHTHTHIYIYIYVDVHNAYLGDAFISVNRRGLQVSNVQDIDWLFIGWLTSGQFLEVVHLLSKQYDNRGTSKHRPGQPGDMRKGPCLP